MQTKYYGSGARVVKREQKTTTSSTGGGQTTYSYQSRVITSSGAQPVTQYKQVKYIEHEPGEGDDEIYQDEIQDFGEEVVEENVNYEDLGVPQEGQEVTKYQKKVTTTTSSTTKGAPQKRVVTTTTTKNTRGSGLRGTKNTGSGSNILQKNYNTTRAARNLDDLDEYKFSRKKLDRGGNYNNIQVTHIIFSKRDNPEFHIIQNLHENGLERKPLDLDRLRREGRLKGGKSTYSCSCEHQKPILKKNKMSKSTAYIHCGGEGTKNIDLSGVKVVNLRTVKPGSSSGKRITTTTTTKTFQSKPQTSGSAYSRMVKTTSSGIRKGMK